MYRHILGSIINIRSTPLVISNTELYNEDNLEFVNNDFTIEMGMHSHNGQKYPYLFHYAKGCIEGRLPCCQHRAQTRTLTLAHSRRPGRPRKFSSPQGNVDNKKVLSPAPSVSFSNLGADSPVGGPPVQTETSVTRTHPMRTRSAVTQDALSARLNVILSRTFHCVLDNPRKVPQKVSPRKLRIRRPLQMGTPHGDPYKYSGVSRDCSLHRSSSTRHFQRRGWRRIF